VIVVIASSMLVSTGLGMVDTVLAMAGHTSWNLGNAILALVVNLGIDLWLIPSHGILGAAIGWAAAIIARNVSAVAQVAVSQRFHPVSVSTIIAIALSVITFVGVGGAARLVFGASVAGLVVGVAAAGACYLAGLWLLRTQLELTALPRLGKSRRPNG
jgi:O-antigen/teichoic acid export membrane protein